MGSKCSPMCPYKRQTEGVLGYSDARSRATQEKEVMWHWRQKLEWCDPLPRDTWTHQNLEEVRSSSSSRAFRGSAALGIPWFQTSGFRNWERIHFASFKPSALWWFVTAAMAIRHSEPTQRGRGLRDEHHSMFVFHKTWQFGVFEIQVSLEVKRILLT